jgi:hypothetical protein
MSLLDEQDLFGSGPHEITVGSPARRLARRGFAGLDGEAVLDMGSRPREITQSGRLQADTSEELQEIVSRIEACLDGGLHTLEDNHGRVHASLIVESFQVATPLRRGRRFWCEYGIVYRQAS